MDSSSHTEKLATELQFWLRHRHRSSVPVELLQTFLTKFLDENNLEISLGRAQRAHKVPALFKQKVGIK